ncbi:MAG: ATP-binding protein [Bacteriovoracaceae bacterium]
MEQFRRAPEAWIFKEAYKKGLHPMTFLTGPRQIGKTFLSKKYSERYFNWDTVDVKKSFLKDPYFFRRMHSDQRLVVFDEIHKRRDWKKTLKGYYDSPDREENFLITGSGRFDVFRKGGDSLQGRYDLYHLFPLTFDEISQQNKKLTPAAPRDFKDWKPMKVDQADKKLLELGGFPAPYLSDSIQSMRKWNDLYIERLVKEDVRDFSAVIKIDQLELLARLLPERVTSPISIKGLSEDIECSQVAIKSWLRLFEQLYLGVLIPPFHRKIHRAVKKEQKWYFFQWTMNDDPGALFENYLAIQLYTVCQYWRDQGHGVWELFYLRDQDRREVDFIICKNLKPMALIEAKSSETDFPTSLNYYVDKLKIPGFVIYPEGKTKAFGKEKWGMNSATFLRGLVLE